MKKRIWAYGFLLALGMFLLKWLESYYFIQHLSLEIYVAMIAFLFVGLGIWMGYKWKGQADQLTESLQPIPAVEEKKVDMAQWGISPREYEVLLLIAKGCANKEIADQLHISIHTVKSHVSHLLTKLGVKRRTQLISKAQSLQII